MPFNLNQAGIRCVEGAQSWLSPASMAREGQSHCAGALLPLAEVLDREISPHSLSWIIK